jgi:hypothetical protein
MRHVFLQPIYIKLLASSLLLGLLGGISIACSLILIILPISLVIKLVIIALILVSSAYFILRDALLYLPWSWQTLEVDSKGVLIMTNKKGQQFQPTLASSSFVHRVCTILNFKQNGFKFGLLPVILFSGAENADELRRLRVWLRWFKH